jgi:ElaB/YqjD/DUF883 family membrane-anchored ribosome-binding protein
MSERNGTSTTATASSSIDNLKDRVNHLVEQGQEKAGDIKNAIVDAKDKVVSTGSSFIASARNLIVDHPFAAVGVAFGVGYVAMRIFRR